VNKKPAAFPGRDGRAGETYLVTFWSLGTPWGIHKLSNFAQIVTETDQGALSFFHKNVSRNNADLGSVLIFDAK
jgi:hypothetical protein